MPEGLILARAKIVLDTEFAGAFDCKLHVADPGPTGLLNVGNAGRLEVVNFLAADNNREKHSSALVEWLNCAGPGTQTFRWFTLLKSGVVRAIGLFSPVPNATPQGNDFRIAAGDMVISQPEI